VQNAHASREGGLFRGNPRLALNQRAFFLYSYSGAGEGVES